VHKNKLPFFGKLTSEKGSRRNKTSYMIKEREYMSEKSQIKTKKRVKNKREK